jgi:uncharacterized membrane protein YhaH (DUF805 family)
MPVMALGWIALSILVGFLGRRRIIGFWGFFIASLLLSPFIVLPILLLTHPAPKKKGEKKKAPVEQAEPA